ERAAGALAQVSERLGQFRRNHDIKRGRREIEERSVDVEQNGAQMQIDRVDEQFALRNLATLGGGTRGRNRETGWKALSGHYLNLPVDAGFHFELAIEDFTLVPGNNRILAFCENHLGKGADRLLYHVAAGGQHRPASIGERLAALFVDQLERDDGGPVVDHHVGQPAGLHADVGAHGRVAVAVVRHDVIGPLGQQHHVRGGDALRDGALLAALELAAAEDIEVDLRRRDLAVP